MGQIKSIRDFIPVLALVILMMTSLACGDQTIERLQQPASEPTPTSSLVKATLSPTLEPAEEVETAVKPTSSPASTAPSASQEKALQVAAQGFGQDEQNLGFAFLVENASATFTFEDTKYQIAIYDDAGTVLETDSGYIDLMLPNQTLGVAGKKWLDEGETVSEIEVQLMENDPVSAASIPAFVVESSTYYEGDYSDAVTGVIGSPYDIDLRDLRVSAVAYDEAGEIVGGGFTFLNFILANSRTGVEVPVTTSGEVATVELYPVISGLTSLDDEVSLPEGASHIVLAKYGFGQDDQAVGFGMIIGNPNGHFAIEDSQYHVTAFAEDGHVLATEEGYIEALLPEQTLGLAGKIYVPEGAQVARVDAQILRGDFVASELTAYFVAEKVTYQPDEYFPQVTGRIISPYDQAVTEVLVSAIPYNEAGEIIGGGFTYLDFIAADGKAAVEVSLTSDSAPATTDLYATLSGLSQFK